MKLDKIKMSKKKAQKEWERYRELLEKREKKQERYLRELRECYSHMRRGRKLIDVFEAVKRAGLNRDGDPKIAVAGADWRRVYFRKTKSSRYGSGGYMNTRTPKWTKDEINLPASTFKKWKPEEGKKWEIEREIISVPVPIIPAKFMPRGALKNYYILWEVKKWEEAPPRDPVLLKRLTRNLFAVLAVWDLTPLERAIIRGMLE